MTLTNLIFFMVYCVNTRIFAAMLSGTVEISAYRCCFAQFRLIKWGRNAHFMLVVFAPYLPVRDIPLCVLWQYAYNSIERANQRCLFGDLGPFISNLLLKSYILCTFLLVTGDWWRCDAIKSSEEEMLLIRVDLTERH